MLKGITVAHPVQEVSEQWGLPLQTFSPFFVPIFYASISNTLFDALPRAALSQLHIHTHTHTHTSSPSHHACPSSFARFLPLLQLVDDSFSAHPLCCVAFLTPPIEKQRCARLVSHHSPNAFPVSRAPSLIPAVALLGLSVLTSPSQTLSRPAHGPTHSLTYTLLELCVSSW